MSSPTVSLSALSFVSPNVTGNTLSIDASAFPFTIAADPSTTRLEVYFGSETLAFTNFTLTGGQNVFVGTIPTPTNSDLLFLGRNYNPNGAWASGGTFSLGYTLLDGNGNVQVVTKAGQAGTSLPAFATSAGYITDGGVTWTYVGKPQITPTFKLSVIIAVSGLSVAIDPPTGISANKGTQNCTLQWVIPSYEGLVGIRVQVSTDPSGITVPFVQYGEVTADVSSSSTLPLSTTNTVAVSGNTTTSTSVVTTLPINYGSMVIPQSAINSDIFYAIFSTIIQDPYTNTLFESQVNGPLACGFVNLNKVSPTDFLALQRKEDIAGRLITKINQIYPDLDLSPRSETRDVFIDPIAIELSNMSTRDWFGRMSTSISAMSELDDANGDGVSDPVSTSPQKQQIQRAYNLTDADMQTLIDRQFDILGEQAGVPRGGATASVVDLEFYTYIRPTAVMSVPVGATVTSVSDSDTAALTFETTASGLIDPQNLNTYYDPVNGWWSVTVPAQCQSTGANTNVGSGTITQVISNVTSGMNVVNLLPAVNGLDNQSNSSYAALIADRLVVGVDSGSKSGYTVAALRTPGVISATVVGAGDIDMMRDWDTLRQKHANGCVDVYVRGNIVSQQSESVAFNFLNSGSYGNSSSYSPLLLVDSSKLRFKVVDTSGYSMYTAIEIAVQRGSSTVYLGCTLAQFDVVGGYLFLNAGESVYTKNPDGTSSPILITRNSQQVPQTNAQFIAAASASLYTFSLFARYASPLQRVPALQPLLQAVSVTGAITGVIDPNLVRLVRTEDFLLAGGSSAANDTVVVNSTNTVLNTATLTLNTTQVAIDNNMVLSVNTDGTLGNVLSVRSADLSTVYTYGTDYTLVPTGPYHAYAIVVPTSSVIMQQTVAPGYFPAVVVSYNRSLLTENLTNRSGEVVSLVGSSPSTLANAGMIANVWLPTSHGNTTLTADSDLSVIDYSRRYIKVVWNGTVMQENADFLLVVNSVSGLATLSRVPTGRIPDGQSVTVSYITSEIFTVNTTYPGAVAVLASSLATTKHSACDLLVKNMVASPVDLTLVVTLTPDADEATVDSRIRSVLGITLSQASNYLAQASVITAVKSIAGVANVGIPLSKCAKTDGSYDIGYVIPTSTPWVPLAQDNSFQNLSIPQNCWISASPLLQNSTIPSGGEPDAYVGLLHEGDTYRRASSVTDFLQNSTTASFYIIGINDTLDGTVTLGSSYAGKLLIHPATAIDPALQSYRVTYQVWDESGAQDITVSSTEYLTAGNIVINYL